MTDLLDDDPRWRARLRTLGWPQSAIRQLARTLPHGEGRRRAWRQWDWVHFPRKNGSRRFVGLVMRWDHLREYQRDLRLALLERPC